MSAEIKKKIQLEIAHVLFIDVVGYSKLSINEQHAAVDQLTQIVRRTEEFQKADASERLIKISTGDGMALVFYTSPEAPVRCAMELSRALKDHLRLHLRMGVHSGPVSGVIDVTGRTNLAGAGLNLAQRVMNCGDAGHILLSKHVAEDLAEYDEWRPLLHDLGECEVKHGARLSVVNLYTEEFGNPALPEKLKAARVVAAAATRKRAVFRWLSLCMGSLLAVLAVIGFLVFRHKRPVELPLPEKSIAVFPFENLSEEKANAYFAEGVQNEILTKLASVRDLKVISRISTAKYQSKPDNLKSLAQELGVSTVLEGAVQKTGDKVRVTVQLIDARADTHLWAKSYDRNLQDVFHVETEISEEIVDALQANLSPNESHALASAGTHDTEVYDLFLRGEYEFHEAKSSLAAAAFDRADAFYRQALARDPNFATAAAALAQNRLCRHWYISALQPSELKDVKSLIDQALAVAPNSVESHLALAMFFYLGEAQYENALTEFHHVVELQPNNPLARQYCGFTYRRRGEWERSLAELRRAEELDPRDTQIAMNIGLSYLALRLWKDAERAELRALAIDPHNTDAAGILLNIRLSTPGDMGSAQRTFEGFPEDVRLALGHTVGYGKDSGSAGDLMEFPVYLHVIQKHFTNAFQVLEKETADHDVERLHQLAARVVLHVLAGQTEIARPAAEQALPLLEARLRERPDSTITMTELSWVYLALGRNADALRFSRQAADAISIEKDALRGPSYQMGLAQIEARAGAPEEAIKRLRRLLSIPAGHVASITRLKIDPVWDPIRDRPNFQQLLSGPEQVGSNK